VTRNWLWRPIAALIAIVGLGSQAHADWQVALSNHFRIYVDMKPEKVRAFAEQLERFDAGLRVLFGIHDDDLFESRRVTVYLLDDVGDIHSLFGKGGGNVAGFYKPLASGSVAFVPRDAGNGEPWQINAQQVLLHEYAHHFTFLHWPQGASPAWFVEGFAEFAETAKFEKDGAITFGAPPVFRASRIIDPTLSLKQVLSARVQDLHDADRSSLYARGWLLTHYLLLSNDRQGQINAYINALHDGKPPLEAAEQAFGDLKKLDQQLGRYLQIRLQGYTVRASAIEPGPVEVAPLSPAAAAVMPAVIRSKRGPKKEDAAQVADLAHKLAAPYPDDPAALNELAEADFDAGNFAQAFAEANHAAALDASSVQARIYQGMAAMRMARQEIATDPARWQQIRNYFIAANRLDNNNAQALLLYHSSFPAAREVPSANAQNALLRAHEIAPFDLGLSMNAATVLLHRNDLPGARAILAGLASNPHAGSLSESASAVLRALDKDGAVGALALLRARANEQGDDKAKGD